MVSDKEREKIRNEARNILSKFGKALEVVSENITDKEISESFREEEKANIENDDFRKRLFENAPKKDKDCIIGEKGNW